ncbi:SP_1767 family glycosyltransferase [Bacillus mycoides]|uniref:SP_1767 family glycosyltransferase n=1 Tax=Bacillus mycoides TaxID=1405 RepID=UPI001C02A132|nr:SP_1767 family glycosyltransferase [Bacillus mycoides]MCQ6532733.1 SP_1767 family glycosyltransferase [Bacillus mycoides]QWI12255.1 SP_1767 family glycosyltransferase [Bacillus mycoides]QWI56760.1 SP_1767 family glycosyltransferase [Bacillus mycoides]QWI88292.1 SP_1767 family glycosyltransferase [Bacillus mycoides]
MKKSLLKLYYLYIGTKNKVTIQYNRMITVKRQPPTVKTLDETLDYIIGNNCSVSRFGDGEFALINGESLIFQPYSKELKDRLDEIIKSNKVGHLVCIPNVFKDLNWCTEKSRVYWKRYLELNRSRIYKSISMNKEYYDALVTRLYIDHQDKSMAGIRFDKIKDVWDDREVIVIEGVQSRLGVGNDLFKNVKTIDRIICPSKNAFAKYREILEIAKNQKKSKLILIALGPTATVLAYDLSSYGYQTLDIGHIDVEYEWFLKKATEKQPVKNKYIGEVDNGTNVNAISDLKYESEIIARVI